MTAMTGQGLAAWQQYIRQHSDDLISLLEAYAGSLSTEDNAWIAIAAPRRSAISSNP